MSSLRPRYTIPFSRWLVSYWAQQIASGQSAAGRNLEILVAYLFLTVSGLMVRGRKLGLGGEVDVLVANFAAPGDPVRWFGDYFLVECKDTGVRVSEKEFGHFLTKLNLTKTKQGAIVSREGFSGSRGFGYSKRDPKNSLLRNGGGCAGH